MLVKNISRIIILALGIIPLLSTNGFASHCSVSWGHQFVGVNCQNAQNVTKFDVGIFCGDCHKDKTQSEVEKRIENHTCAVKLRHHQKNFLKKTFVVQEGKKYRLDNQSYITRESSRIVLVDGKEKYKYIFTPDTIVLMNNQGQPIFIESLDNFQKVPLPLNIQKDK
jgi:hypothetical protein